MLEEFVREGLRQARLYPSRARGQHFLIDDSVLARIITAADLQGDELVIEIGPGLGTLTRSLAARCWRVYAYELDDTLVRYLKRYVLPETRNIVLEDVAFNKYVLEKAIALAKQLGHPLKIVTNLPYQISSAFLHSVVDYAPDIALVVVMLQREVCRRVVAQGGDEGLSSFSIYLQTFLEARWICDVPKFAFLPPPKVASAVLALRPLAPAEQPQPVDRERYFKLVEGVFRHRRKQLLNALQLAFPHLSAEQRAAALAAAGIDKELRPGDLGLKEYVALADALAGINPGQPEDPISGEGDA